MRLRYDFAAFAVLTVVLVSTISRATIPLSDAVTPGGSFPVLNGGGQRLVNVGDPTGAQDVATKHYVDGVTPTGAAGGDLSGTYPNPGVAKLQGVSVPAISGTGVYLTASAGALSWEKPPYFRVTDYGATGNGTSDDTTAIQAAITAAGSAGGGTVLFDYPATTYKISAPLTLTTPGVTVSGTSGPGTLTHPYLTQATYGAGIFQASVGNVRIRDLSGQYGPTTTLASSASASASTLSLQPVTLAPTATVTNGSPTVVFSSAPTLEAGELLSFSTQPGTWYTVVANSFSATSITLTTNYSGTGGSGATVQTSGCAPNDTLILDQWGPLETETPMEAVTVSAVTGGSPIAVTLGSASVNVTGTASDASASNCGGTAGCIKLTVSSTTGIINGVPLVVASVGGTTEADGLWSPFVVSSTTVDLQGSTYANAWTSGGTAVQSGATTQAHSSGAWVRTQAIVQGAGAAAQPARNFAGFASFVTGDDTLIEHCAVLAMVVGSYWRGEPSNNSWTDSNNGVDGFHTAFTQYMILPFQQTDFAINHVYYEWSTSSQPTAPGHAIYMTGLANLSSAWAGGSTYALYDQVSSGTALAGTATVTSGSPTVTFSNSQTLSAGAALQFSSQTGYAYVLASPVSGTTGTLTQNYGSTSSSSTATIVANPIQYISLADSNVGNTPVSSPSFWSPQTLPSTSTGWRTYNRGLSIHNVFVDAHDRSKDWSGVKVKWTQNATISDVRIKHAVRGFDLEECDNCTISNVTASDFVQPLTSDSSAAAIDLLDCNATTVDRASVNLTQSSDFGDYGAAIDMPAVYNRTDYLLDPRTGAFQGLNNTFSNISAITNYDASYTSQPFRTQGQNAVFSNDRLVENGGNNPFAFNASANPTFGTFANGMTVILPVVSGTTNVVAQSAGTTGVVASVDGNLLPAGYVIQGGIARNDQPAALTLTPTSTSATVIGAVGPASENFQWISLRNSAGNTEFSVDARQVSSAAAMRMNLESSSAANPPIFNCGTNAAAGYSTSGQTLCEIFVTGNNSSASTAGGLFITAAENQSGSALGTNTLLKVVTPGTTTPVGSQEWYGNGDISLNASGSALATNATSGFTYLPTMAGTPSGVPAGHTGAVPTVYDTTDHTLYFRNGGSWEQEHPNVTNATGTLPVANIAAGTNGQVLETVSGSPAWATLSLPYTEDSPSYHSLQEWNGQPAYITTLTIMASGSLTRARFTAQTSATISNVWGIISTAGSSLTAATTTSVTGAVSSSGLIELTVGTSPATNTVVTIAGVTGTTEANGAWLWTSIDGTHGTLQGSTFTNAYVSGGTVTTSANAVAIYSSSGTFLTATGDLVSNWGSTGSRTMALAASITLTVGNAYCVEAMSVGTTPPTMRGYSANAGTQNINLSATNLRWAIDATGLTKLPSSVTPASGGTSNLVSWWMGLN